eukprot:jgi/Chrzof1/3022/Cz12g08160.t1
MVLLPPRLVMRQSTDGATYTWSGSCVCGVCVNGLISKHGIRKGIVQDCTELRRHAGVCSETAALYDLKPKRSPYSSAAVSQISVRQSVAACATQMQE